MVYTVFNSTGAGMGELFTYAGTIIPYYSSMLFGFILLVITFSIYFIKESKSGSRDFPVAFSVGCTVTTILAGIMQMLSGFVSAGLLGILISLSIISYIWLFTSKP